MKQLIVIDQLWHLVRLYIANVILPLASVSQSCTGYYPMYRVCKAAEGYIQWSSTMTQNTISLAVP